MRIIGGSSGGLIGRQTLVNQSACEFVNLPATGKLVLDFYGLRVRTTGQPIIIRFSHDNGANYIATTSYGYDREGAGAGQSNSASGIQISDAMTTNAVSQASGTVDIYPPDPDGQDRRMIAWQLALMDASNFAGGNNGGGHSHNPSGAEINAIQIFASSGNIDGVFTLSRGA